jgi:transcriptional regulator with XRE-family HTH domain
MAKLDIERLAKILKEERVSRMLSLREVERATGILYTTIQAMETGRTIRPSYENVVTLADFYNFNIKDLTDVVFEFKEKG